MINSIFKLLGSALAIWEHKEKNKYFDKYMSLKRDWYEEYNKEQRNDARLDNIEFELSMLVDSLSAKIGNANSSDS